MLTAITVAFTNVYCIFFSRYSERNTFVCRAVVVVVG